MTDASTIESLLRDATDRAALPPLLRALGLEPLPPQAVLPAPSLDGGMRPAIVARSDGLVAVLLELPEPAGAERLAGLARAVQRREPLHPHLVLAADPGYARLTFAATGLDGAVRQLAIDRRRPARADLEALTELAGRPGESGVALALRHARVLERSRVTRRFFRDFRARRDAIAAAWRNVPAELDRERDPLALLFLSRLMFLYFLQREGHLAGDPEYLPRLVRAPVPEGSIYRGRLEPLFFGALNRRLERREPAAQALGALPYLNGGLFERHPLERKLPGLDLPDDVVLGAFELLLDRYRFTAREGGPHDGPAEPAAEPDEGIDPEMLGRVFEDLMAPDRRGATGSFYTPAPAVARLVRDAVAAYAVRSAGLTPAEAGDIVAGRRPASLDPGRATAAAEQLRRVRVLDPACGSGAFLLGALTRLATARLTLVAGDPREVRRDIVAHGLHGVDVQADAALLCALRLWLALAGRPATAGPGAPPPIPPLPNLDLRVRQGDALLDPMDLIAPRKTPPGRTVRAAIERLRPLGERYLGAEPGEKEPLMAELRAAEVALARAWITESLGRLDHRLRELSAAALELDLFGQRTAAAREAERERVSTARTIAEARQLEERLAREGELPFFSFAIHFAGAHGASGASWANRADGADGASGADQRGFDLVLSNPPWLRACRWPPATRRLRRARFEVCRAAGWRRGADLGGAPAAAGAQVDMALLFLERALELLASGGILAMVLPAKLLRSLFGAGGRRLLLQRTRILVIEDHSLDQHSLFRADAYAATVIAEKLSEETATPAGDSEPSGSLTVRITMVRRRMPPLRFAADADELPLAPGDADSPWLLAPPAVRRALRRMQSMPALGDDPGLRIRRGVFTGANDVLLVDRAEAKLGDLAVIHAAGARLRAGASKRSGAVEAYEAVVEARAIVPAVRGSGLGAWTYRSDARLLWVHDDVSGAARPAPPRLARYLERHGSRLEHRAGRRGDDLPGALFRVTPDTLRPKVAWQDLDAVLEAVALPALGPGVGGGLRPLIPLNTVYFIPVPALPEALVLAAYLNSLPLRTFARAVAERAKDARFRFFAWVVALLPLPRDWRNGASARALLRISKDAHAGGRITPAGQAELDRLVATRYGLQDTELDELRHFDRWLRGER